MSISAVEVVHHYEHLSAIEIGDEGGGSSLSLLPNQLQVAIMSTWSTLQSSLANWSLDRLFEWPTIRKWCHRFHSCTCMISAKWAVLVQARVAFRFFPSHLSVKRTVKRWSCEIDRSRKVKVIALVVLHVHNNVEHCILGAQELLECCVAYAFRMIEEQ